MRYKRSHPTEWRALTARYAERDLLTFSMTVWMRPKAAVQRAPRRARVAVAHDEETMQARVDVAVSKVSA
jgi:hypothetical protein